MTRKKPVFSQATACLLTFHGLFARPVGKQQCKVGLSDMQRVQQRIRALRREAEKAPKGLLNIKIKVNMVS